MRWQFGKRLMGMVGRSCILLLFLSGCTLLQQPPVMTSVHLRMGNPSRAAMDTRSPDNYLMIKPQYALSYNNSRRSPNWVSWQLDASWLGTVPRRNDFRPDDELPASFYRVVPSDYNNSGYDRGHMSPSGDRTNNPTNNSATFLMTNILPQTPDNNQGPWNDLEIYCRALAKQGKELFIISGGYGKKRAIGAAKIVPPSNVWKVIVVLDQPGQGVQGVSDRTRVIAVDMPNIQGIKTVNWRKYRVTVDQIEATTGYNLLSNLSEPLQQILESRLDAS